MKKIIFIIAFALCNSLLSLEKSGFLTTYLMKLEPPYVLLVPREISTLDTFVHFCSPGNGFYEGVIQKRSFKKLSEPFYQKMLLTSLPALECIVSIVNCVYPQHSINFFFGKNFMIFQARKHVYNFIKWINQDELRNNQDELRNNVQGTHKALSEDEITQLLFSNLAFTTLSILTVTIANVTCPDLFAHYTYLNPTSLAWDKSILLYIPFYYLLYKTDLTQKVNIHTTYFDYSLYTLLTDIETIFEAKRIIFLTSIFLACIYLKSKNNNLLTNPTYWVPVGIVHVLYTKSTCANKLLEITNNRLIRYSELDYSKRRITAYLLYNAIPISAVLINNCMPT